MKKSDLVKLIESAKDEDDINSLLAGTDIETQFKGEELTLDVFKQKAVSDKAFKQFMDSEKDTHHSKALKTMKEKGTWENEFFDVLTQKYPDLIKDPVQIELAKERKAREELEAKLARKDLLAEATKYASEKKLPVNFVDRFLGDDLDSTKTNLDGLADVWAIGLEAAVNEKMKLNSYIPGGGGKDNKTSLGEIIAQQNNNLNTAPVNDIWGQK